MSESGPAHDIADPDITVEEREAHIVISIDGTVVADSQRPSVVRQTNSGVSRYYLPPEDVRSELLEPSSTTTHCPYKGDASHHSARIGDTVHVDVAWTYNEPLPAAVDVAGWYSFYDDKVHVAIGPVE